MSTPDFSTRGVEAEVTAGDTDAIDDQEVAE
jgi:hypothetical protein